MLSVLSARYEEVTEMQTQDKAVGRQRNRNRWAFGMGTIGRDALFTMVSMYLIYYRRVLNVSVETMWSINFVYRGSEYSTL